VRTRTYFAPPPSSCRSPTIGATSTTPSTRCLRMVRQTRQLACSGGLLSLLQQDPLNAPAASSTSSYQHVIILFADGLNTGDRWYGDLSEPELASRYADEDALRQHQSHPGSENTGKSKFTMYTVQIDTDGASQSAVLPYCASDSSKFFMLTKSGRRRLLPDRHPDRQAAGRKIGPFRSQKSPALRPGF
jgi:hypothetical protein